MFSMLFSGNTWESFSRWVNEFQKEVTLEQDQKRCVSFSGTSSQKEQFGSSCTPILVKNSLVAIRLCKSLNWNSISFVLLVHLKAN